MASNALDLSPDSDMPLPALSDPRAGVFGAPGLSAQSPFALPTRPVVLTQPNAPPPAPVPHTPPEANGLSPSALLATSKMRAQAPEPTEQPNPLAVTSAMPRRPVSWGGGGSTPEWAPALVNAVYGQESSYGANPKTSDKNAHGGMQIIPATFARYAMPGEQLDNAEDNKRVGQRILNTYAVRYGDPARAAVAYFSGEGNVAPPGSPTPWIKDASDGHTTTSQYVAGVLHKMGQPAVAGAPQPPKGPFAGAEGSAPGGPLSGQGGDDKLRQLVLLQALWPHFQFKNVQYDPYAVAAVAHNS